MIHAKTLHFVQWNENPCQEQLVFFFQRQGKAVDDTTQDFKQLSNTIETLCFINELEEDVVDRAANI